MTIGSADDARSACFGHDQRDAHDTALLDRWALDGIEPSPSDWHKRQIGSGERRTAWLVNGVVYKVGPAGSNRYEHEMLTVWREAGAAWAPLTALYEVEVDLEGMGLPTLETVVAMEYLPDDRSEGNPDDLAAIYRAAPQTCPENWCTVDGRTYLIDGEDIECEPLNAPWPTPRIPEKQ